MSLAAYTGRLGPTIWAREIKSAFSQRCHPDWRNGLCLVSSDSTLPLRALRHFFVTDFRQKGELEG